MQRRRYLRAVGAAAALGLAGCSGDGGDGDGSDGDEDGGGGTADRDAAYYISVAVSELNTAAIALADYQERFTEGNEDEIEFDQERQSERLTAAREALDAAASKSPSDDEAAQIEGLRAAADAIAAASGAIPELRTATDELDDLEPAVRDREFSTARQRLSAPADRVSSVADSISSASQRLNRQDPDRMEATNLRFTELRDGVAELATLTDSFDQLLTGYDSLIAAGERIQTARDALDEDRYDDARSTLGEAETDAREASSTFQSGVGDAPDRLEGRFETATCQSGHLVDAITLFQEAAEQASNGENPRAKRNEAEDELQRMENC